MEAFFFFDVFNLFKNCHLLFKSTKDVTLSGVFNNLHGVSPISCLEVQECANLY